jgi:hypothetical protein
MTADFRNTSESIVELIARRQVELGKTDEQVARELSFDRVTAFTMIKQGTMKLPVQKVAPLASALSIEPAHLLRQLLAEAMPEVLEAVDTMFCPMSLTPNEVKLIQTFRDLANGKDVTPVVVDGNAVVALMVA